MNLKSSERSTEWIRRLPEVVSALNSEVTRLTGKKPVNVIKGKSVDVKSSTSFSKPVGLSEKRLDSSKNVRHFYAAAKLVGGQWQATDPVWAPEVYSIEKSIKNKDEPVL